MDNDVKIYKSKANAAAQPELGSILQAVNAQRSSGNIEKARKLGKRLATITPSPGGDKLSIDFAQVLKPKFFAPAVLYQIKVLMIFAAEASLQLHLPGNLLATTATNAIYDYLRKHETDFYRNISDGAAFTFYYLAIKKGGDIDRGIGETFAMLCSAEDNESFIEAGMTVFGMSMDKILEEINAVEFAAM